MSTLAAVLHGLQAQADVHGWCCILPQGLHAEWMCKMQFSPWGTFEFACRNNTALPLEFEVLSVYLHCH